MTMMTSRTMLDIIGDDGLLNIFTCEFDDRARSVPTDLMLEVLEHQDLTALATREPQADVPRKDRASKRSTVAAGLVEQSSEFRRSGAHCCPRERALPDPEETRVECRLRCGPDQRFPNRFLRRENHAPCRHPTVHGPRPQHMRVDNSSFQPTPHSAPFSKDVDPSSRATRVDTRVTARRTDCGT